MTNPHELTLDRVQEHHRQVIPGPYRWTGDLVVRALRLANTTGETVMGFCRWSQQGGVPTFKPNAHRRSDREPLMRATEAAIVDPNQKRIITGIDEVHARYFENAWSYIEFLLRQIEMRDAILAAVEGSDD